MNTQFTRKAIKIGNSLGVTIPDDDVRAYGYKTGQAFRVILEPITPPEERNPLLQFLSGDLAEA